VITAPVYDLGLLTHTQGLIVALILGVAFGFFLEQGGLGDAKKLAAQFYFNDLTVLKVMFSAIVTAMLGLFWLGRLGLLDLGRVYLLPTFVAPQLAGGVIFGVGFVMGGLCPGTSCVALSSGRLDGFALLGGMLLGIIGFNEAYPLVRGFYESDAHGQVTLAQLVGVPHGVMVLLVVLAAIGSFMLAEQMEGRLARVMAGSKQTNHVLAGTALVLALLAPLGGNPFGATREREAARISAIELGQWLRARRNIHVVDLRSQTAFDTFHLPRAELGTAAVLRATPLTPADTIVVYGAGDGSALRVWEKLRHTAATVRYMTNGVDEWVSDVLNATLLASATPAERAAFESIAELSRYFGGEPHTGATKKESLNTTELLRRQRRRGCAF
jgi:uncharacterized membrane protein YedE/YeeE